MSRRKWTNLSVDLALRGRSITCKSDIDATPRPSTTKVEWCCQVCEHTWHTTVDSVINHNSGCPSCAGNIKMTLHDCNVRLTQSDRTFACTHLGDGSRNKERKGTFICLICDNVWTAILSNVFLQLQGCPSCGKSGKYSASWFSSAERKNTPGILYVVELHSDEERFLKIGITKRSIGTRFKTSIPYGVRILHHINCTLYEAWRLEQQILQAGPKYTPKLHFGGHTECLDVQYYDDMLRLLSSKGLTNV